jgi:pimeloyl-ACP methyl ester carboxylesterase
MEIQPFTIHVPDSVLEDLHRRLAGTRWPDSIPGSGWSYGADLETMQRLTGYWQTGYNWRRQEVLLNSLPHFRANIDGLTVHFIHLKGEGPRPLPLLVTHGWPSSFFEMYKLIPLLTDPGNHGGDPADAFDLVVPSMPGFGFSDKPSAPGMVSTRIAGMFQRLMVEGLGYSRFGAHGGDIGAGVTTRLGYYYPENLPGIHVMAVINPNPLPPSEELSAEERAYLDYARQWDDEEGGYRHIQGTRPQTLAYGLNDSPAGLAAWIVEKYAAWSDCQGDIDCYFTQDDLLTMVMIYWVTGTIHSSMRAYYETRHNPNLLPPGGRVRIPTGVGLTREQVDKAPRSWAERTYNLQHWTEFPRGGHFMALEEPELLAADLREFFRPLRG